MRVLLSILRHINSAETLDLIFFFRFGAGLRGVSATEIVHGSSVLISKLAVQTLARRERSSCSRSNSDSAFRFEFGPAFVLSGSFSELDDNFTPFAQWNSQPDRRSCLDGSCRWFISVLWSWHENFASKQSFMILVSSHPSSIDSMWFGRLLSSVKSHYYHVTIV
jgi:hypothetical protein